MRPSIPNTPRIEKVATKGREKDVCNVRTQILIHDRYKYLHSLGLDDIDHPIKSHIVRVGSVNGTLMIMTQKVICRNKIKIFHALFEQFFHLSFDIIILFPDTLARCQVEISAFPDDTLHHDNRCIGVLLPNGFDQIGRTLGHLTGRTVGYTIQQKGVCFKGSNHIDHTFFHFGAPPHSQIEKLNTCLPRQPSRISKSGPTGGSTLYYTRPVYQYPFLKGIGTCLYRRAIIYSYL